MLKAKPGEALQGLGAGALRRSKGSSGHESQGHSTATAAAIAPHAATALPSPLAGPAGSQQGKPAQNPAPEHKI